MPSSKSKSAITTITEQYDQRIMAEAGAIVIGSEATAVFSPTDVYAPTTITKTDVYAPTKITKTSVYAPTTETTKIDISEFSDNVAAAFNNLVQFAEEAGDTAIESVSETSESAMSFAESAISAVAGAFESAIEFVKDVGQTTTKTVQQTQATLSAELERKQIGTPSVLTQILPYMAVGLFAIAGLVLMRKK